MAPAPLHVLVSARRAGRCARSAAPAPSRHLAVCGLSPSQLHPFQSGVLAPVEPDVLTLVTGPTLFVTAESPRHTVTQSPSRCPLPRATTLHSHPGSPWRCLGLGQGLVINTVFCTQPVFPAVSAGKTTFSPLNVFCLSNTNGHVCVRLLLRVCPRQPSVPSPPRLSDCCSFLCRCGSCRALCPLGECQASRGCARGTSLCAGCVLGGPVSQGAVSSAVCSPVPRAPA